jgi:hypothetical protein
MLDLDWENVFLMALNHAAVSGRWAVGVVWYLSKKTLYKSRGFLEPALLEFYTLCCLKLAC